MVGISRLIKEMGVFLASSANYTSAYVLTIVWNLDPLYFASTVLLTSFLFGAVVVDLTKSTIYTSLSMALGMAMATGLLSAPSIIFAEGETLTLVLFIMTRYVIIGLIVCIFGMLIGCIVGDVIQSKMVMREPNID